MLIFGAGAGVAFPALMMLAMSGATPSDAGLASGLVNTTGQVGGAIGLALLATVSTERTKTLLDGRRVHARGADGRLPPRVPDRRVCCRGGDRGGGDRSCASSRCPPMAAAAPHAAPEEHAPTAEPAYSEF